MTRQLTIADRVINDDSAPYVIAEIGHNHQGSLKTAKDIFRAAAESGASAVKLQKRHNRSLFTRQMYDTPYDNENSFGATYGEHREALEFDKAAYEELLAYVSTIMPVEPGDVIATGTPVGVGGALKPPVWLVAGDVVEIEVSGVGVLRNTVQDEA